MNLINAQFLEGLENSMSLFKPEIALLATFVLAIILDLIFKKVRNVSAAVSFVGFAVAGAFLLDQTADPSNAFSDLIVMDPFAKFFKIIILLSSIIVLFMSLFSKELYENNRKMGEYYVLMVGMTFGMFLLASATNLIVIYLAIETMSISSYVLAGYTKEIRRSSEASLKYVIFGAVSSGLMIYGISILFGLTGTLNIVEMNAFLAANSVNTLPVVVAGLLIIAGIGYKISAVPFHFWTPDVYEGAPVTITAYLSVASKAAGFAILIRFLKFAFIDPNPEVIAEAGIWQMLAFFDWKLLIAILSVVTMTVGNLVALWQDNLKRLFAYSSIAHAGYLLMGVVVMSDIGVAGVLVYFFAYLIMNLGAFYVVMLIANKIDSEELDDYAGIGYRAPLLGVAMTIFMISLTGIPPTVGFIGKFYVFAAVLKDPDFIWLAVVGVINTVISLFYYVKVFRNMFVRGVDQRDEKPPLNFSPSSIVLLLILVVPTILYGIFPNSILVWAKDSVAMFMGQ